MYQEDEIYSRVQRVQNIDDGSITETVVVKIDGRKKVYVTVQK